jgi:hypothetical protein
MSPALPDETRRLIAIFTAIDKRAKGNAEGWRLNPMSDQSMNTSAFSFQPLAR